MTRTLWIEASPKGEQSLSSAAARAFVDAAGEARIGTVDHLDLWSDDVLTFNREAALMKFAPLFGETPTSRQQAVWRRVEAEIERVRRCDRVVVSAPMWNWSIPAPLKNWIDVVVQPLLSFTLDGDGRHVGTLGEGRPLHLVLTRSSAYDGRHPELRDFQLPYLEYVVTLLGYAVDSMVFEPTTRWTAQEREQFRRESVTAARQWGAALPSRSSMWARDS
ncbi:FMN-dependent NADH-azoreductase [Mycolicibacterium iranicum]|uniref:FMN dependent NADH:quinone oxidoreductase n=1 Tax=Mycolicibacterium iranicum TaxID=912594 RepID=A0A839Q978_MYCIR|nr:NAD(P)H-dependent oxidoreductase [Mycolicibacterium iranicum]MBB2989772.1 FMN-dependent NADH-azoreductase [Mycolicibacterium iranicum]